MEPPIHYMHFPSVHQQTNQRGLMPRRCCNVQHDLHDILLLLKKNCGRRATAKLLSLKGWMVMVVNSAGSIPTITGSRPIIFANLTSFGWLWWLWHFKLCMEIKIIYTTGHTGDDRLAFHFLIRFCRFIPSLMGRSDSIGLIQQVLPGKLYSPLKHLVRKTRLNQWISLREKKQQKW